MLLFSLMHALNAGSGGGGEPPPPDNSVTAQRWRILGSETQAALGSNTMTFAELDFLNATGDVVSTSGATITESNTWGGGETGASLFDGDATTDWATPRGAAVEDEWVECDFGTSVTIAGCILTARDDAGDVGGIPTDWKLQYWDGASWIDYITIVDLPGWFTAGAGLGSQMRFFKNGRTWRLRVTETEHGDFLGLDGVEFRSASGVSETHGTGVADPYAHATNHWGAPTVSTESAGYAFDGDSATHWGCNMALSGNQADLFYSFSSFKDVAELFLDSRSGSPTHAPRDFTLAYSDDGGGTFTTVLTVTGESAWSDGETRTYAVSY